MLLKGENLPSSEVFPGQEDSSVEDCRTPCFPSSPSGTLFRSATRERYCGGSAGARQTCAWPGHTAGCPDGGDNGQPGPPSSPPSPCTRGSSCRNAPCRDGRRSRRLYVREKHPPNRLFLPVPAFSCLSVLTSARLYRHGPTRPLRKAPCFRRFPGFSASSASTEGRSAVIHVPLVCGLSQGS